MPLLERAWQTAVSKGMDPEEAAQAVADALEHALPSKPVRQSSQSWTERPPPCWRNIAD